MTKHPEKRAELTEAALSELNGNAGQPGIHRILQYISDAVGSKVGKRLEWCGTFCLFLLHKTGIALNVHWKIGGGFCEEQHLTRIVGKKITTKTPKGDVTTYTWAQFPEAGDIAYYDKPFSHHAMVLAVNEGAGTFDSIDGNQVGDTIQTKHGIKLSKPTHFYSIEKLLDADGAHVTHVEPPVQAPTVPDTEPPAAPPELRQGTSDAANVLILQQLLNHHGAHPPLKEDGSFGALTRVALENFQELSGLDSDGICGPDTWADLLILPAPPTTF